MDFKNKIVAIVSIFVGLFFAPMMVFAINVSVPAAPSSGYMLVATSTGAYIATTTDPAHFGSIFATSTTETNYFAGSVQLPTITGCNTTSALTTNSTGVVACGSISGGGGGGTVTASPQGTFGYFATQGTTIAGSYFGYASSTNRTVILGAFAGGQNATTSSVAQYETAIGWAALTADTSGIENTAIGDESLEANISGLENTGVGVGTLQSNTSGSFNTSVGYHSSLSSLTGTHNAAVGYESMMNNTATYGRNTSVGYAALNLNTTGTGNTDVGSTAGNTSGTFSSSTLMGWTAGTGLTSGNSNVFIGNSSGGNVTIGSYNIVIGDAINATSSTAQNSINIGDLLFGSGIYSSTNETQSGVAVQGLFGISTSSPQATLSVQGNELLSGNLQVANINATGTIAANTLTLTTPLGIASGGTNAGSFTTSGNGVYWNGTSLLTAPLTSAVIYPYASSTAVSASSELNAPHSGTVPTLAAGDAYVNTNSVASSSVAFGAASQNNNLFAVHSVSSTFGSSTLAYDGSYGAAGTTSIVVANPIHSTTMVSFYCKTDTGTAWVGFKFGSGTETTEVQCTSTGAGVSLSTNNTGTGRQAITMNIGMEASTPNNITVTADLEDSN